MTAEHFEVVETRNLYRGRTFGLRQDRVRLPDGQTTDLDIVEHSGAVVMLPIDAQGNILFVRQYRHAAGGVLLELPAGTLKTGETPQECAAREMREETGMAAAHFERIGEGFAAPGYSTEFLHFFAATGLTLNPAPRDPDEFLEVVTLTIADAYEQALDGRIRDTKTLAGLLLARPRIYPAAR